MTLEKIKKVDWRYVADRRLALLFMSLVDISYCNFKKAASIDWGVIHILRFSDGKFYHSGREIDDLGKIFLRGGEKLLKKFAKKLIFHVSNLDKLSKEIGKTDCSGLTRKELVALLDNFSDLSFYAHNFLTPMIVADKVLSKIILDSLPDGDDNKKEEWLGILTQPVKENEYVKEQKSFYRLAIKYKRKSRNFNRSLNAHLRKYGYLGAKEYWWDSAWTKEDILDRLDIFSSQNKNPLDKINNLIKVKQEREVAFNSLLKELEIKKNSKFFKLIEVARDYAYLRTWRTEVLYGAGYRARNLFYEIARGAGAENGIIPYLTISEARKMAREKKLPITMNEFRKRKKFYVSVKRGRKFVVFSGRTWFKKLKRVIKIDNQGESDKVLRGNIAYPGIARGMARIVEHGPKSKISIKRVKKGDIMVATMTFPNFIPAMEKAAAFVTDEGGILCHAAIVAREMKKPCIIGTKIATQVLKDGDEVEVDANKGVVKILSRH
ncbi:MAG: PEP-utilizing enzyme [Patescibacteria group bacterium]|nr:PEP-utilizing enzyme [Patescibacteria group bacterium]